MPAGVRRNLESLPWMDQDTLDRVVAADTAGAEEARR
jgi:hypothetical protein